MYKNKLIKGKILKKISCLALAIVMLMTATACGGPARSSSEASTSGNNTLTISVIAKDMYLDTAVKLFQEQHPGTTIEVKEYTSNPLPAAGEGKIKMMKAYEAPEDVEKYVNAMNTQLMSGKGPDMMLLNPLPYENYINKNMLANLSDMIKADKSFDINDFYTNILDAMKYNGNLYGFPLSIKLAVLEANKALLDKYGIKIDDNQWTWDDFRQTAETVVDSSAEDGAPGMYALAGMDGSMLISSIVSESFNKFADISKKTAGFDTKEFIDLLNLAKSMIDKNYINTETNEDKVVDMAARGNAIFGAASIRTYVDLMMAKQVFGEDAEFMKYPGEGTDQSFTAETLYGINEKSSNKALAWEFLKFLVSEEMASQALLAGLPVNKAASQAAAQNAIDISKKLGSSGGGKLKLNINGQALTPGKPLTQEDVKLIEKLVNRANKYNKVDRQVVTIVQEETKAFFEGQKTADDTAKAIQDRVNIYINE